MRLTPLEHTLVRMVMKGMTTQEIARTRRVSVATVRHQLLIIGRIMENGKAKVWYPRPKPKLRLVANR